MRIRILVLSTILVVCLSEFPPDFIFGASTAAFQIEGAWLEDDKSPSVWDNFAHLPNYTADGKAPDIGPDSYHRFQEDIDLMKKAGIKHYRMSISWPRIVPRGRANATVNPKAIKHYREVLKALIDAGITPYVTLYHWDLPAILAIQGYGLVDIYFVRDFLYFAEVCFKNFGDLVKFWFTFNEPWVVSVLNQFKKRDEGTKPYKIAHNLLLAHAHTVNLYRTKYKEEQKGKIGIVLNSDMFYPKNETKEEDINATKRALLFILGWFADPVWFGDYSEELKERLGNRLPNFTNEEKVLLNKSSDFFGINHYASYTTEFGNFKEQTDYWSDRNITDGKNGWNLTDMGWPIVPKGIYDLLAYIQEKYLNGTNIPIYITENGMANKELTKEDAQNDKPRIDYLKDYLEYIEKAITEKKANVQGYFVWSLIDNFEWWFGFSKRFGLVRIEYSDNPERIPKSSLEWYAEFIRKHST